MSKPFVLSCPGDDPAALDGAMASLAERAKELRRLKEREALEYELVDAVMTRKAFPPAPGRRMLCAHLPDPSTLSDRDVDLRTQRMNETTVELREFAGMTPRWGKFRVVAGKCSTCGKVYGTGTRSFG